MEKRYCVPAKVFLSFFHLAPNSLVIQAAMEQARQQHACSAPADKVGKRLDFLGHKVFSSASLQFRISSYLTLLAKYDFLNYGQLEDFADKLPPRTVPVSTLC